MAYVRLFGQAVPEVAVAGRGWRNSRGNLGSIWVSRFKERRGKRGRCRWTVYIDINILHKRMAILKEKEQAHFDQGARFESAKKGDTFNIVSSFNNIPQLH